MASLTMGPMPPTGFLQQFMTVQGDLPSAPDVTFEDVPTNSKAKNESAMYPWLVRTNSGGAVSLLTGCITRCETSSDAVPGSNGASLRATLALVG